MIVHIYKRADVKREGNQHLKCAEKEKVIYIMKSL